MTAKTQLPPGGFAGWRIRRLSPQASMYAFVALVCVLLLGHETWRVLAQREEALIDGRKDINNIVRSVAQQADNTVRTVDSILSRVVEYAEAGADIDSDLDRIQWFLRNFAGKLPQINAFALVNSKGDQIAASIPSAVLLNVADRQYFQFHRDNADTSLYVSRPVQSKLTGKWIIPVTRRVSYVDGRFAGLAVATINVDYFQDFYNGFNIGEAGAVLLASGDGILLVRRPFVEANIGRDLSKGGIFKNLSQNVMSGSEVIKSSTDGVMRINSYQRLQSFPLVVAVAASIDEILEPWWKDTKFELSRAAILACIIALMGVLIVKRTRESANQSALLAATLGNMGEGLIVVDEKGIIQLCNSRAMELLELPENLMASKPRGEDIIAFQNARGEFAGSGEGVKTRLMPEMLGGSDDVYQRRRPNGQIIEVRTTPFAGGGVIRTYRDITQEKQIEQELRDKEARFRLLAENISDVIVLVRNHDDERLYVSPSVKTLLGYSAEQFIGMKRKGFVHPGDARRLIGLRATLSHANPTGTSVHRLKHKDGHWIWVETSYTLLDPPEDGFADIVCVIRDVSERHRQAEELQSAKEAAEVAAQAKSEFLASMSHELRTPLNSIIGFSRLAINSEELITPSVRRYANLIHDASNALLAIINDILDVSKLEANGVELDPLPFSPRHLVESTAELLRGQAEEKGLELQLVVDPAIPAAIIGDDSRLRQVLLNLVTNAVKFTARGHVRISLQQQDQKDHNTQLRFSVADTGIGIPEAKRHRLFKKFSQVDGSTSREYGGTGLGLSICKSLVELMGGAISVESVEGEGSIFSFELSFPLADAASVRDSAKPIATTFDRPLNILVAEDVAMNQELITAVLSKWGHRIDIAPDGAAAVAAVSRAVYDLVLMDVRMPVMDGIDATKHIRALGGAHLDLPILAMTASVLPDQIALFKAAGMNGHVAKPFREEALARAIMEAAQGSGVSEAETVGTAVVLDREIHDALCDSIPAPTVQNILKLFRIDIADPFEWKSGTDEEIALITDRAHRVVSSAGFVGFMALSSACAVLEEARLNGGALPEVLARAEQARREALLALDDLIEQEMPGMAEQKTG